MNYEVTGVEVHGVPVYIQVEPDFPAAEVEGPKQAAGTVKVEDLASRLEVAGEAAAATCAVLYSRIDQSLKTSLRPAEISLEFGISLGGEAGIPFVAKGTVEASFKVTATWKPGDDSKQPDHV